jgi:signal transduction histidine kinase
MAQSHAAVHSTLAARRPRLLNVRLTVLACVVLICGSFAAAAVLQTRNDRIQALTQAEYFEARRAGDVAAVAGVTLDRLTALGRDFADGKPAGSLQRASGVRAIAVFDRTGRELSAWRAIGVPAPILPSATITDPQPALFAPALLTFAFRDQLVALSFDPHALVPKRMLQRAALTLPDGTVLLQDARWSGAGPALRVTHWPLLVRTSVDEASALAAWTGSLPLYLFVILGPALAGAGMAVLFVREFERRARTSQAIRALKTTRPVEARLLVRLAQAERAAAQDARAKAEFIAHMSHELRTPLNAIIGFSEVIERGFYGNVGHPKYVEYAHDINEAGHSLHNKIGDILEFANIEAGRYPLRPMVIDVSALAAQCVSEHEGRAFSRRITLHLGFTAVVEALADPLAVRRILTNLLSNALLYTHEGGTVRLEVHEEEGAVVISVTDNGHGFTRVEAAAAGVPFKRFERPGVMTGVGMGLTIAMALARRMGGAIRIGSVPGEGTLAELRLPKC